MSGHKTRFVSISEAEYRRLHDAEMKLRSHGERSTQQIESLRRENELALWEQLRDTQARQRAINQSLDEMGGSLRQVEDENCRLISMLESELYTSLQQSSEAFFDETSNLMEDWSARIAEQMQVIERRLDAGLEQINLEAARQSYDRQAAALGWLRAAQQYLLTVQELYYLDESSQADLNRVDAHLRQAEANLQGGLEDAALVMSQQAYLEASLLRVRLENSEQENAFYFNAAHNGLVQLEEIFMAAQTCQAMDMTGQLLPVQIDVDFWTSGELSQLFDHYQRVCRWLQSDARKETAQLKKLAGRQIPEIKGQLDEIVFKARWQAISSQLRINIAGIAVQALELQGFELTGAGYNEQDQRAGYSAYVLDYGGSQVHIRVQPLTSGGSELHIISDDADYLTEHELLRREGEITKALGDHGLVVQHPGRHGNMPGAPASEPVARTLQKPARQQEITGS